MSCPTRLIGILVAIGALVVACGGKGGNDGTQPPASPAPPSTAAQNPCPASSLASTAANDAGAQRPDKASGSLDDGDPRGTLADLFWRHRAAEGRVAPLAVITSRTTEDVGEIAVIQDAMGLIRDIDLRPLFYVEHPTNVSTNAQADSAPRVGVTFSGTRRDVLINDVVEVMGMRQPSAENSPRRTAGATAIAKIDRIRRAWETFFTQATDGRGRVETRLQTGT